MTAQIWNQKTKKNIKCNIITQAYRSRCSSEALQVIKTFRIVQRVEVSFSSLFLKTMISDFFLSSGAVFLNIFIDKHIR